MNRVDILVTFDFDAETAWRWKGSHGGPFHGPSYESQGTFGPKVGVWRVLDVLRAFSVPATFFVPGWVAEHHPAAIEALLAAGHEIAGHSYLHEKPSEFVSRDHEEMYLVRGKQALERVTGTQILGYRPGDYIYTDNTLELLKKHGFLYGSAMQDDDSAYVHEGPGEGLVEIPVLWHLTDDLFGWHWDVHLTPSQVEEHWLTELRELGRYENRIFVPTMHPQVIGHPGRLAMFERVLQTGVDLGSRFLRCEQLARELLAGRSPVSVPVEQH